jgi:hypothetical protein
VHGTERTELLTPSYAVSLASVLPSVAASLGVAVGAAGASGSSRRTGDRPGCAELIDLPPARGAVVVLVDGLGAEQLQRRGGHAPFMRTMASTAPGLTCGFPSTTATSMGSFGTGLPPGVHGMVGWQVLMPGRDRLLNQLSWHEGPDPLAWQPHGTVFEQVAAAGLPVTRVGPAHFEASGLTRAALRGGRFAVARRPAQRVTAALAALARDPRALVYLYWGEVDKTGHEHGPDSWQWGEQVEAVDAQLADLARRLPAGTSLTVTADHGMVHTPEQDRHDLAYEDDLAHGIRHLGGEPRAPQAYCEPGAAADVLATWRAVLGEEGLVLSRQEAVAAGWFGPVREEVLPRIGDLVVAMRGRATVLDSRALRPEVLRLRGHHGSLTLAEMAIPLLHLPA